MYWVLTVHMASMKNSEFCFRFEWAKLARIGQRNLILSALVWITLPNVTYANTEIVPFVSIRGSLVDNETDTLNESGYITTVAPGISVVAMGARSSLRLDYLVNVVNSQDLDQDDEEVHELNFLSSYQHSPGKWQSSLRASSQLTNIDINGVQNVNPDFIDDNSEELRTIVFNTTVTDRVTETIQYRADLSADYADYADSDTDDTDGHRLELALDNFRSPNDFTWSTRLNRQVEGLDDDDEQIDTLNVNLRYQLNRVWGSFFDVTRTETDFSEFDDDQKLVGLTWQPSSRTSVSFGAGERGDDNSYSLDAVHTVQHVSFSANYLEEITTSRTYTLNQLQSDQLAQATTRSISILPVLQKRASLNFAVTGNYSTFLTSIFQTDRSEENTALDERITGIRVSFTREIGPRDDFRVSLLGQESEDEEINDLTELTLTYTRLHSNSETINITLDLTNQDSTLDSSEYERAVFSAEYRVTF